MEEKIPRPRNAFILFRQHHHKLLIDQLRQEGKPIPHNSEISKLLGTRWRSLSTDEKSYWDSKAQLEKEEHEKKYPDYKYRPVRRKRRANSVPGIPTTFQQHPVMSNSVPMPIHPTVYRAETEYIHEPHFPPTSAESIYSIHNHGRNNIYPPLLPAFQFWRAPQQQLQQMRGSTSSGDGRNYTGSSSGSFSSTSTNSSGSYSTAGSLLSNNLPHFPYQDKQLQQPHQHPQQQQQQQSFTHPYRHMTQPQQQQQGQQLQYQQHLLQQQGQQHQHLQLQQQQPSQHQEQLHFASMQVRSPPATMYSFEREK